MYTILNFIKPNKYYIDVSYSIVLAYNSRVISKLSMRIAHYSQYFDIAGFACRSCFSLRIKPDAPIKGFHRKYVIPFVTLLERILYLVLSINIPLKLLLSFLLGWEVPLQLANRLELLILLIIIL